MADDRFNANTCLDIDFAARMHLSPADIATAKEGIDAIINAADHLNRGCHIGVIAHLKPFVTALARFETLRSDIGTMRRLGMIGDDPDGPDHDGLNETIDSTRFAAWLTDIMARYRRGEALSADDEAAKRFFVGDRFRLAAKMTLMAWRAAWVENDLAYHPARNAQYPIHDCFGAPLPVVHIDAQDADGKGHLASQIWPFLDPSSSDQQRASLYAGLARVQFSKQHARHMHENLLLGENTVITQRDYAAGECLGVYAGTVLTIEERSNSYNLIGSGRLMDVSHNAAPGTLLLDGENILSKLNTILDHDPQTGMPISQAQSGYNVDFVPFIVQIQDGRKIRLTMVFALQNIAAGTELRVNYNYTKEFVRLLFNPGAPVQN